MNEKYREICFLAIFYDSINCMFYQKNKSFNKHCLTLWEGKKWCESNYKDEAC